MKQLHTKLFCAALLAAGLLTGCARGGEQELSAAEAGTTAVTVTTTAETTTAAATTAVTAVTKAASSKKTEQTTAAATAAETTAATTAAETEKAPETTAQASKGFSDDELIMMARAYYGSRTNHIPEFIDVESETDGIVTLHLYDLFDGHTSTADWYYVSRQTGKGTNLLEEPVNLHTQEAALWNPEISMRKDFGDGNFCAVLYLGNTDTDLRETLRRNVALMELPMQNENYKWFSELPEANYAETDGGEMYLIIPRDSEAHVVITSCDPVAQKEYGRIYSSYNGAPVLLRCNQSEIASNVRIQITDNSGVHPAFSPYLSGRDGSPLTDCNQVKILNETE